MKEIPKLVEQVRSEGWCQIEGVIPDHRIEEVRQEILDGHQQAIDDYERWGGSWVFQSGPSGERGTNLVAYVPKLASHFADERVVGVAQSILDPHVRIAQTEFKTRQPHDPKDDHRAYHSDFPHDLTDREQGGCVRMPFPNVTMGLTVLWILSPYSSDNGGTWVVPGSHVDTRNPRSHLDPRNRPELHDDVAPDGSIPGEIQLSGPAGTAIMIDSRIWHSTACNPSPEPRVTMLTRFVPWWLSLEFGGRNTAIVPRASYEAMPEGVKLLYRHRAEGVADPIRKVPI